MLILYKTAYNFKSPEIFKYFNVLKVQCLFKTPSLNFGILYKTSKMLSYSKEEKPGYSNNQIKVKPKSSSIQSSVSDTFN